MVTQTRTPVTSSYALAAQSIRGMRQRISSPMAADLTRFFSNQADRVVSGLLKERKAYEPKVDYMLLTHDEDTLLMRAMKPYIDEGIISSSEMAAVLMGEELPIQPSQAIQDLLARSSTRVVRINETTRNAVRKALQEAQLRGYNLYQTAYGVPKDKFRGVHNLVKQLYKGRGEAIARTEIGEASQTAAHQKWSELGVKYVDIIDGDVDGPCAGRNGTRVPVDSFVGMNHPNCTVVSIPVVGNE